MNGMTALALAAALASVAVTCRRRWVRHLGAHGHALAPPFLLVVWFGSLGLGQSTRSLAGMAWAGAAPLVLIAGLAVARTRRLGRARDRWSAPDVAGFALISAFLIAYCGNDNIGHYSMVGAYLRGNIPPSVANDPGRPLGYHTLFDAGAAVVADALGVEPETALDLASIACVFACFRGLQGLSRALFEGRWARQCARLFFVLGFGPIYLNHVPDLVAKVAGGHAGPLGSFFLHGQMTQSFVEAIPRRPMGLNYVLFVLVLAAILPRMSPASKSASGRRGAPHPAWLLPCAFVLPQTSEDLTCLATLVVAWAWLSGSLPGRWLVAWAATIVAALPLSGVLSSIAASGEATAPIRVALAWPPTLPYWADLEGLAGGPRAEGWAIITDGLPLASKGAARVLLTEWGPLFLGGLAIGLRDPRRRVIVAVFAAGFVVACGLRLRGWVKADFDRFLFYGTAAGFLLAAAWVELAESAWKRGRGPKALLRPAVLAMVVLPTILGPAGFAARYIVHWASGANSRYPIAFSGPELARLRRALAAVGPRELILTDAGRAQDLVLAGFVVVAPLAPGFAIGVVDLGRFDSYTRGGAASRARWMFLPAEDPRVAGHPAIAEHRGYRLVRTPGPILMADALP